MVTSFFSNEAINRWRLFCCVLLVALLSSCQTWPVKESSWEQQIISELRQNPHLMVQHLDPEGISAQVRSGDSFQVDSLAPTPALYGVLDHVISVLHKNRAAYRIVVVGHTDNLDPKNPQNTNYLISSRRAALVKRYLIDKGIDESLVSSEGKGSAYPLVDNETEEGRNVNRRIELLILPVRKTGTECPSPYCGT